MSKPTINSAVATNPTTNPMPSTIPKPVPTSSASQPKSVSGQEFNDMRGLLAFSQNILDKTRHAPAPTPVSTPEMAPAEDMNAKYDALSSEFTGFKDKVKSGLRKFLPGPLSTDPAQREAKLREASDMASSFGAGGIANAAKGIVKKAATNPALYERIGGILKGLESGNLDTSLSHLENNEGFFKELGLEKLGPKKIIKVLNDVMSTDKSPQ